MFSSGCSADVGSAPQPTQARCPHSDSSIYTTNFWHSPSPGPSPQSAHPLRSAQAPLDGVVAGHKANIAFSPSDFLLQHDDLFSMPWHNSTGPAWPVLWPRAAPGLADALRFLASLGWRLPLALRPASSTSFYPCGLELPVTRCFMRLSTTAGRPEEATPSTRRLAEQALHDHGLPPPASTARRDTAWLKLLPRLEGRSLW